MRKRYLILLSWAGLVLSSDQLTKYLVQSYCDLETTIPIIPNVVSITYTRNPGIAFGFFQRTPASLESISAIGIPLFALILIVLIFIKIQDNQMSTSLALTSILAGAIGNLVDRVQYGFVIDFLDIHLGTRWHFTPFNVADAAILFGVTMMFFVTLRRRPEEIQSVLGKEI